MSFGLVLGGLVLVIGGLGYGAFMLQVPTPWIAVGAVVLLGLGVLIAVKTTQQGGPR